MQIVPTTGDFTSEERARLTAADMRNPNVCLVEGRFYPRSYHGEYSAAAIKTADEKVFYLLEMLTEFMSHKGAIMSFAWHLASEPKGYYELQDELVFTAMGISELRFAHAYSDLTGYLWTNEEINVAGHDVFEEITKTAEAMGDKVYIAMRVEIKPKENEDADEG